MGGGAWGGLRASWMGVGGGLPEGGFRVSEGMGGVPEG